MTKPITFDSFMRWLGIRPSRGQRVLLLNILSGVLTPFFVAWLLAYLLYPVVKFVQYKCMCATAH